MLYEWQEKALKAWLKARGGIIVAPTGAGKTTVAVEAIRHFGDQDKILFCVPYKPLLQQHLITLLRQGIAARIYDRDLGVRPGVTLATYAGACRDDFPLDRFALFILDEVHHLYQAEKWGSILEWVKASGRPWMGLTATPDGCAHDVIYHCTIQEAVANGAISGLNLYVVNCGLSHRSLTEVVEIDKRIETLRKRLASVEDEDEEKEILLAIASLHTKRRIIIDRDPVKLEALAQLCSETYRSNGGKVLCFVSNLMSISELIQALRDDGIKAYTYNYVNNNHGIISMWRSTGGVLLAINALDEGLNVPDCKQIIIASCPKMPRRAIQRIGRGLRPGGDLNLYVLQALDEAESVIEVARRMAKAIRFTRFVCS
jgi:superfamily II DNA or RNA helicase